MNRLLLCPPDHYAIRYEINPWMNRALGVDQALALAQWEHLRDMLLSLGCEVEVMTPQPGWPDMVFTANAGLATGRRFIRANFRHAERAGEAPWFEQWFTEHGFDVSRLPHEIAFEGEGDALCCDGLLFCGHAFRTDQAAHVMLGDLLGCEVISLKLTDAHFYHLDTCFCPLGAGAVVWFPDAFDDASRRAVCERIADRIEVSREEASRFACNAIVLGRDVVLPEGCPLLCAALHDRGFKTHPLPMSEFIKAGGACKCLALLLPPR